MNILEFKIFDINDDKSVLVFIFESQIEANRRYNNYGTNLNITMADIEDNQIAIEFKFTDINLTIPGTSDRNLFDALNLSKLTPNGNYRWSCGYYSGVDIIPVYPLKPLTV